MAKIKPMILIQSMSGKVCGHSDTYFTMRNGVQYTGTICNKRTTPFSEAELKNQAKFKKAHAAALVRKNDAKQQAADLISFKNQKNIKPFSAF